MERKRRNLRRRVSDRYFGKPYDRAAEAGSDSAADLSSEISEWDFACSAWKYR